MSNKATLWKLVQDKQELVAIRDKRMEGALFARDVLLNVKRRKKHKKRNTFVDSRNVIIYVNE